MQKNQEVTIRGILIVVGILFIIYSFYSIYLIIEPIIQTVLEGNFSFSLSLLDFSGAIIFLILGIVTYFIGRHWKESLKSLSLTFVGIAVFFMSISIFLFAFNSQVEDFSQNIQPSFDLLIAKSIDNILSENLKEYEGSKVTLILSESQETLRVFSKNLTLSQANIISNALEINSISQEEKIILGKVLIDNVHSQLLQNNLELLNAPIPLSILKEKSQEYGFDLSQLNSELITLLEFTLVENSNSSIVLLLLENQEEKEIEYDKLTQKEIDYIWSNLNLETNSLSNETKELYVKLFIGVASTQLEKYDVESTPIPIGSISSQIPDEIKKFLRYDIGTSNLTQKAEILSEIREECKGSKNSEETVEEVCNMILLSEYDYLMENIDEITTLSGYEIPNPVLKTLEPFSSTKKIEITLENKTNYWKLFLFLSIIFYILAHISYYLNFRILKKEIIPAYIPLYISKHNIYHLIFPLLSLTLIYYLIAAGHLLNFISSLLPEELGITHSFLSKLGLFETLITIISKSLFLFLLYVVLSILVFAGWYFLIQKGKKLYGEPN